MSRAERNTSVLSPTAQKLPRYVQLIRVSSKGQADKATPEIQRAAMVKLDAQRPGIEAAPPIEDGATGLSGALGGKDRPDLAKLFALLAARKIDEVRCYAIDRLSRSDNEVERATILQNLKDAGAVIVDASGSVIDPSEQMGQLMGSLSLLLQVGRERKSRLEPWQAACGRSRRASRGAGRSLTASATTSPRRNGQPSPLRSKPSAPSSL